MELSRMNVPDADELERIDRSSKRILEEVGVKIQSTGSSRTTFIAKMSVGEHKMSVGV